MPYRPNPFACALLMLGSAICLGGLASDGVRALIDWPTTAITAGAVLVIALSLAALLGAGVAVDAVALVVALLTAGMVADLVLFSLALSADFGLLLALASVGTVMLIAGGSLTVHTLVRVRTPQSHRAGPAASAARPAAAATVTSPVATTAPPGWYPDPSGGAGQRYWDGSAWGQAYP